MRGTTGAGAMVIKLAYTEARQRFGELCLRVLEREALDLDTNEFVEERLRTLALTIAAGSSQIQRNIISERVLGLPREPRP
jgi:alkylation response protein AidB-like acyl-CoA dehydrogenase